MSELVPGLKPPSWVPGPFQPPRSDVSRMKVQTQPRWRSVVVPQDSTLADVSARFGLDWSRIFNDNRAGVSMPDGSAGWMAHPNQVIPAGQTVWLS